MTISNENEIERIKEKIHIIENKLIAIEKDIESLEAISKEKIKSSSIEQQMFCTHLNEEIKSIKTDINELKDEIDKINKKYEIAILKILGTIVTFIASILIALIVSYLSKKS